MSHLRYGFLPGSWDLGQAEKGYGRNSSRPASPEEKIEGPCTPVLTVSESFARCESV